MSFTEDEYGTDIRFSSNMQFTPLKKPGIITKKDNLEQAIYNRMRTFKGELVWNNNYGSDLQKLIGQPMTETNQALARLYFVDSVMRDPRIKEVTNITTKYDKIRNILYINATVETILDSEPLNLVFPFFL
jgi:phage baseplate assembly protein W